MHHLQHPTCAALCLLAFGCGDGLLFIEGQSAPEPDLGAPSFDMTAPQPIDMAPAADIPEVAPPGDMPAGTVADVVADLEDVEDMGPDVQDAEEDLEPPDVMEPEPPVPMGPQDELDLTGNIGWMHPNISAWPITSELRVRFDGSLICMEYDKKNTWPQTTVFGTTVVVANAWVFAKHEGRWYGGTFEWMRPGQTCKAKAAVEGGHIKVAPFDARSGWAPRPGDELYFMVSGLIRMPNARNVSERTNVVRVIWQ